MKQGCRIVLHSYAGSAVSKQKSISRASSRASSSSSSRAKLAKAELEKRKAQEKFLKETDDIETEQAKINAECKAKPAKIDGQRKAERQAEKEKDDAEPQAENAEIQETRAELAPSLVRSGVCLF